MKQIDFDHGTVTGNILGVALPMLVAQILSLLYNIVDRIYIARIVLSNHCDHHCIQQFIWKWRSPDIFNQQRKRKYKKSRSDHEYIIFNAVHLWSGIDGDRNAVRKFDSDVVRGVGRRAVLRISIHDDLFDRNSPIYDCNRDEPIY